MKPSATTLLGAENQEPDIIGESSGRKLLDGAFEYLKCFQGRQGWLVPQHCRYSIEPVSGLLAASFREPVGVEQHAIARLELMAAR